MAQLISKQFEQNFFRKLNAIMEPAVRRGFGSPRFLPAGLILLESVGFKSGQQRRTPLLSFQVGRYRIVTTARSKRSFWVKNLVQQPRVSYFLGGKRREAEAIVFVDESHLRMLKSLYQLLQMFRKRDLRYQDFLHKLSSYLNKTELNQLDAVELLRNYPNQHEHHVMQELLREQGDQSKLMN